MAEMNYDSTKTILENGNVSSVYPEKFKRRKVSARRDFPPGCGRFAARIDKSPSQETVVIDAAEKSAVRVEGVTSVAPEPENALGFSVDLESHELSKTSELKEMPESVLFPNPQLVEEPKGLTSETVGLSTGLNDNDVEYSKTMHEIESVGLSIALDYNVVEPSKTLDLPELLEVSGKLVSETSEFLNSLGQNEMLNLPNTLDTESLVVEPLRALKPEAVESLNSLDKPDLPNVPRSADQPEVIEMPSTLGETKILNAPVEAEQCRPPKVLDQTQGPVSLVKATTESLTKNFPRKRVSAVRDFPPGCGRNALLCPKEERLKIRASLQTDDVKSAGPNLPLPGTEYKSEENNSVRTGNEVRAEDNLGSSKRMVCKESVKHKTKRFIKQSMGDLEEEASVRNEAQYMDMESFGKRTIVQALMAAPNCPWRQGKRPSRSNATKSGSSLGKNKVKGQECFVGDIQKSVLRKGDSIGSSSNKEGKAPNKKSHSREKADSEIKNESFVEDQEDSLPNVVEGEEQDDDGGSGSGGDEGKFFVVSRRPDFSTTMIPFGLPNTNSRGDYHDEAVTRNKVRETLRLFQALSRKLLQEEEAKSKNKPKNKRVDLAASNMLKEKNKWVNTGKQILGNVPGVEVGDEFHYRVELAIIGLHRVFQAGIDYIKVGGKILATSIVASGGYPDEMDSSDVLIYSGQGGIPAGGKKAEDQKLERGNLALKNSMEANEPVRVIRGYKEAKASESQDTRAKMIATYVYDGLYLVEKYWKEIGNHGCSVFKFMLRRLPGQPELAVREIKKAKKLRLRAGLCLDDISEGKEKMPIPAFNNIDDERPFPFKYITKVIYPSWYNPTPPQGCDCTDGCSDSEKCLCALKNGGEIPFNYNGAIVEAKPLVYECGPSCKCPPSCPNRVSQHGIKFQLEIFKTNSMGWGVRSLTSIPSGSFVCEYIGELLEDKEAEQRTGNDEYLFDIGHNYNDHALWDGLSTLIPDPQSSALCDVVEDVGFTIDAAEYGNVGRFINHSCSPNLYAQNVLYDHDDRRLPRIMLFAAENIPPLQELTYHYNYAIDTVRDSDGNIKMKNCYCGSHECSGRLY